LDYKKEFVTIFLKQIKGYLSVLFIGPLFLVPAIVVGMTLYTLLSNSSIDINHAIFLTLFISFVGLFLFAYPLTLVVGLPAMYLLNKYNKLSCINFVMTGIIVATAITLAFKNAYIYLWFIFCYCAISVCLGCWFVYRKYEEID